MLFFNGNVFGQVSIAVQGFESGDSWTISSGANISSNTGSSDTPANQRIRTGSNSHQTINTTRTLILNGFSDNTHTDRFVNVWLSSTSGSSGNGADGSDYVEVYISSNSTFGGTPEIKIKGNNNVRHGMDGTGVVSTTVGTPYTYTYPSGGNKSGVDAKSKIEITDIPNSWTEIHLKIITKNNSSNERWNIDDIELFGTNSSSNDADAEANDTGSQPAAGTISSVGNDDSNNPVDVFNMDIYDWGASDGLPTHVTNIRIKPNTTNTADWTDNIQGVVIDDGANFITPSSVDITDTYIDMHFTSGDLDVANNDTRTVNIAIYLNTSNIEDGKILSFMVDADDHGFTADPSGTQFKSDFGSDFYSNDFEIEVEATELQFQQQPTDVEVNTVMTPAVTVAYTDANGNVDVDYDGLGQTATLSATGSTLAGTTTTAGTPVSGIMTFDDIEFTTVASGVTLTVTDSGNITNTTETSNTFDVTAAAAPIYLIISKVVDPSNDYKARFVEIANIGSLDIELSDFTLMKQTNGGTTYNISLNSFTMKPGYVYVVSTKVADFNSAYGCDPHQSNTNVSGNGDDGYFLKDSNGDIVDSYGVLGEDGTGKAWEYTDSKALRKSSVTQANPTWTASEWDITACVTDDFNPTMCDLIPIKLLDFSAKKSGESTLVSWSTLSEVNNDYFSVEWSTDGVNFEEIAKVDGAGTSRDKREYSFVHKSPKKGINYYRLTQYDFDGRSETFNIVSVVFNTKSLDMAIIPNRVENSLRLEFTKPVEEGRLHIYNMGGQKVKSYILATGVDAFNFDISGFTAGQYIAKFVDSNKTISKRFVKL